MRIPYPSSWVNLAATFPSLHSASLPAGLLLLRSRQGPTSHYKTFTFTGNTLLSSAPNNVPFLHLHQSDRGK